MATPAKMPPPERDWYNLFEELASIKTEGKAYECDLASHVPTWAGDVLLNASILVQGTTQGKGHRSAYDATAGNLFFYTKVTHSDGSVGMNMHPGVWHTAPLPLADRAVFDNKQGSVHATTALWARQEFGALFEVPLRAPE